MVGLSKCAWLISVPERTINLDTRRAKPIKLVVEAGGRCFDIFSLAYHFGFSFLLSLEDNMI